MNKLILILFCLSASFLVRGQQGNITVIEDAQISNLIGKHIYLNQKQKLVGWRLQIFFESGNNSKSMAFSKKGRFMALYPEESVYLVFQAPYYKVRVGDFRTRIDAEGFKLKILKDFSDAFVVKDEIRFPGFH